MLSDYLDHVARLRLSDRAIRDRIRTAREFLARHPDLAAWMALRRLSGLASFGRVGHGPCCAMRSVPAGCGWMLSWPSLSS
ncbi:phage integrase family domain protein [Mycobacterium kansasii 824]|nr:phage integrase family domain protein [Mycobacterium kansasii 824]